MKSAVPALLQEMIVGSTWFAWRQVHKQTQITPNETNFNQIDKVPIKRRHLSALMNLGAYKEVNRNSGYYLVGMVPRE